MADLLHKCFWRCPLSRVYLRTEMYIYDITLALLILLYVATQMQGSYFIRQLSIAISCPLVNRLNIVRLQTAHTSGRTAAGSDKR
jgi:hypothetical protein